METVERNATSRASFKCTNCLKTFTDLEVSVTVQSYIACDISHITRSNVYVVISIENQLQISIESQADQLFDMTTGEFRCTYCREIVEEDQSALPKVDSRLLLARFNEQLQPLYTLLKEVEGIKLAPEILEPEPVDINIIRGYTKISLSFSLVYNITNQFH